MPVWNRIFWHGECLFARAKGGVHANSILTPHPSLKPQQIAGEDGAAWSPSFPKQMGETLYTGKMFKNL